MPKASESETKFLPSSGRLPVGRTALWTAAFAWLPLLVLSAWQGTAWGDRVAVPLLRDFLPYGRYWLALPVLILAESTLVRRVRMAGAELHRSSILAPREHTIMDGLLERAAAAWQGWRVNIALLLLTYAITALSSWRVREVLTGGWMQAGEVLSAAGWWQLLVSAPLLRFLTLRWMWRYLIWVWLLWRSSRLPMRLQPTHPDRAGGLAFLGTAQSGFAVVVLALGLQVSCLLADAVSYRGVELLSFKGQVLAFIVLALGMILAPLCVFTRKLARARDEAMVQLSNSGYLGAADLDEKLRNNPSTELPVDAISALCDFAASYDNARQMRFVPLEMRDAILVALAAALPFAPLAFLVMPAEEVFRKLAGLLL